jgi:quercetin dioxygenase-like cupin family protein/GNAT superfamily N-acetyltransferase
MAIPHAQPGQVIDVGASGEAPVEARSHALFKSDDLEVIRLVLAAGRSLPPHRVAGDITVLCLEGRIDVSTEGRSHVLSATQMLFLEGGVRHGVTALENASALVTIALRKSAPAREPTGAVLRQATMADSAGIWDVRYAVRENTLRRGKLDDDDMQREIERSGRGWVVEDAGRIVAFAVGNADTGNIWALFVHPDAEGRGHGGRLHDTMVEWLWSRGLERLWLTTGPGTRAQGFYERRGWQNLGLTDQGEILFELRRVPD